MNAKGNQWAYSSVLTTRLIELCFCDFMLWVGLFGAKVVGVGKGGELVMGCCECGGMGKRTFSFTQVLRLPFCILR